MKWVSIIAGVPAKRLYSIELTSIPDYMYCTLIVIPEPKDDKIVLRHQVL